MNKNNKLAFGLVVFLSTPCKQSSQHMLMLIQALEV